MPSTKTVPGTFAPGEREELVAYLVKNFGPESKKRGLAVPDAPIDEKALGKAMFVEYHIPPLAKGERGFHDAHLSQNGDVWYVDARGLQIGKMDPRTGIFTEYKLPLTPGAMPGSHHQVIDKNGIAWISENWAHQLNRLDPKTGAVRQVRIASQTPTPLP